MGVLRRGRTAVAAALVAGSGMGLVVAQPIQPAQAASGSTVQVTNVGTIPGSPNHNGRVVASCPSGTFAVGGGVDPGNTEMAIVSDGPTAGGKGLDAFRTGPMPTPDGWEAVAFNFGNNPEPLTVTAICEPSTGGNIAPVTVAATVTTSTTSDRTQLGNGEGRTAEVTAACPGSDEALSGGVDVDVQTVPEESILNLGPATAGTPVSWAAQLAIASSTPSLGYVVGALCTDPSEGKPGLPALGVPSVFSSDKTAAPGGPTTLTGPVCPAGSEAVGGGAIDPTGGVTLDALTPLQAGGALPSTTPAGTYPAATQWVAKVINNNTGPETVTVSVICVPPPRNTNPLRTVTRLAGPNRDATAVAVSQNEFPAAGTAKAVVLSRDDSFADALAGTPLAVHAHGPLLLTPTDALDPGTQAEIQRVLPAGGTVFLLGGTGAISQAVADTLSGLGFTVTRIAGQNRFDTAVQIAQQLGNPATVIEATGMNFPDALAAGAAAAAHGDALLLTNDTSQASETAAYLAAHPADTRIAVGGQAAAADPDATPIVGVDRYDTAAKVATTLFSPAPATFGAALGTNFPDALAGGARSGLVGEPLLLVTTSAPLPTETASYLSTVKPHSGVLYGGTGTVDDSTLTALETT